MGRRFIFYSGDKAREDLHPGNELNLFLDTPNTQDEHNASNCPLMCQIALTGAKSTKNSSNT